MDIVTAINANPMQVILTTQSRIRRQPNSRNISISNARTGGNPKKINVNRVNVPNAHRAPIPTKDGTMVNSLYFSCVPLSFVVILVTVLIRVKVKRNNTAKIHDSNELENGLDSIPSAGQELANSSTDVGTGCRLLESR
jgi:hypothetical protein